MSHLATRLLAAACADASNGINAVLAEVPRHGGDAAVSPVTVYNDTQHNWVTREILNDDGQSIAFPCVRLWTVSVTYDAGVPQITTGAVMVAGTAQVAAQPIVRDTASANAAAACMYILRALRSAVARFDDPANEAARTFGGVRLLPCSSIQHGKIDAPIDESLVAPAALLLTYPFVETVSL